jgi:hypothetical protein
MILIVIALLFIVALAATKIARLASLPDAEKSERLEMKRAAKSDARGALLLIGLPIFIALYALSQWFA